MDTYVHCLDERKRSEINKLDDLYDVPIEMPIEGISYPKKNEKTYVIPFLVVAEGRHVVYLKFCLGNGMGDKMRAINTNCNVWLCC